MPAGLFRSPKSPPKHCHITPLYLPARAGNSSRSRALPRHPKLAGLFRSPTGQRYVPHLFHTNAYVSVLSFRPTTQHRLVGTGPSIPKTLYGRSYSDNVSSSIVTGDLIEDRQQSDRRVSTYAEPEPRSHLHVVCSAAQQPTTPQCRVGRSLVNRGPMDLPKYGVGFVSELTRELVSLTHNSPNWHLPTSSPTSDFSLKTHTFASKQSAS